MENNYNNGSDYNDNQNQNNNGGNDNNNKKKPTGTLILLILSIGFALIFWKAYDNFKTAGQEKVTYDEFIKMLEENKVSKVKIYNSQIIFEPATEDEDAAYDVKYVVVRT